MHTVYPYFVEWFTFVAHIQLLLNCNCFDAHDLQLNVFDKLKQCVYKCVSVNEEGSKPIGEVMNL